MVTKLKSISRQIHWFLAAKALLFVAAWLILPFWLFLITALYLFFFPTFHSIALSLPFFTILGLSLIADPSIWFAALLFSMFFLLLGIKELFFVDRKAAYETLILLILFAGFILFFLNFSSWSLFGALLSTFLLAALFFFLTNTMLRYLKKGGIHASSDNNDVGNLRQLVILGIASLILWQMNLAVLFLPISFFFQSALLFFVTAVIFEVVLDYMNGDLTKHRLLLNFSFLFVCIVFVLAASDWNL